MDDKVRWSLSKRLSHTYQLDQFGPDVGDRRLLRAAARYYELGFDYAHEVRAEINGMLSGERRLGDSGAFGHAFLDALIAADYAAPVLFRGLTTSTPASDVAAEYRARSSLRMTPSSFSSKRKVAAHFAARPDWAREFASYGKPRNFRGDTSVMLRVSAGSQALSLKAAGARSPLQCEWLGAGIYDVRRVRVLGNTVVVDLDQTSGVLSLATPPDFQRPTPVMQLA